MNHLEQTVIKDKKVGLRVDLNVPIENGEILSHERLSAALPTILYILKQLTSYVLLHILADLEKVNLILINQSCQLRNGSKKD